MNDLHPLKLALLVGLGGSLGALARYGVARSMTHWLGKNWPLGTLTANLTGCLALGLIAGLAASRDAISPELQAVVMVGFLGAYTTFSTFSLESVTLLREADSPLSGPAYIGVSILGGLLLAWLGYKLGGPARP